MSRCGTTTPLKSSEWKSSYRAIFETGNDAIFVHDLRTGQILDANRKGCEMYGYTEAELRQLTTGDLSSGEPPFTQEHALELIRRAANGEPACFEWQAKKKTGELFWVDVDLKRARLHGCDRLLAIVRDITDRKNVEQALRAERDFSNAVLDTAAALIVVIDPHGCVMRFNRACEAATGYSPAEACGRPIWDFIPPEDVPGVRQVWAGLRAGVFPNQHENHWVAKDGSRRLISWSNTALVAADGSIQYIIATGVDITDRKRAEEALNCSEAALRKLIDNAPYGIYETSVEGQLLKASPALVAMLGYGSDAETAKLDLGTDVYADPNERRRIVESALGSDLPSTFDTQWKRKDGSIIDVRLRCRKVRRPDGSVAFFEGFAEDVTQQHAIELQLRQAQKMEAVGQLAGGVAHDFNNLLMLIFGHSGQLAAGLSSTDPLRAQAEEIIKAAERARSLIRQLLAFSRKQVLTLEVLDINTVLAEMQEVLRRLFREDIELVTTSAKAAALVRADFVQVQQIILNLALNARDAMPRGGRLEISVEIADRGSERLGSEGMVVLRIADTGCGMTPEVQAHIFEPFFTTKEPDKGTGLGLATAYGIVRQIGGRIFVESHLGRGTIFRILLPRVHAGSATAPGHHERNHRSKCGSPTILLVEDETGIRTMTRSFLEQNGYSVLEAKDGEQALFIAKQHDSPIHLLVSDIVMPGIRGTEVAERLRHLHPETKVLLVTGYSDTGVAVDSCTVLEKPFSMDVFAENIDKILSSGTSNLQKAG